MPQTIRLANRCECLPRLLPDAGPGNRKCTQHTGPSKLPFFVLAWIVIIFGQLGADGMDQMVGVSLSRSYKIKQSSPRLRPVALRRTDPALSSPAAVCESQFQCNSDWGRGISTQNSATSKMQCNLLKTIGDLFFVTVLNYLKNF